jgi:hypothetical protein
VNRLLHSALRDPSIFGKVVRKSCFLLPGFVERLPLIDRLIFGKMPRIYYSYCAVRAAQLAHRLGYREVSFLEFGVASGKGLIALEEIKTIIERHLPIKIRLVGFDLGSGLPKPLDYRDLPYHWQGGFYEMDVELLKRKLASAELMLGPVAQTVPAFVARPNITAPIGMISFDLDYYSSTVEAFKIFEIDRAAILPRVMCYMDDITGSAECYSDFTGERLAIAEFNEKGDSQKISPCYDFQEFRMERWQEKIMIYHDFRHKLYNQYVGDAATEGQIPLAS